jgi:DNA (cytosine-5)-methyltransferase 1
MREKLQLLDLFSGIGGFSLGLERSGGFETVAFCEIEDYPRRVLARHWPEVPIYGDIKELNAARLRADGIRVDAICGGFPCQDISTAGAGAGIEGERSGLWREYARLIGELRPRVVFVENVAALLGRGLDRVLGDLAALGYDAEWHCIPASAVGAPHRRDRLWILAHPGPKRLHERWLIDDAERKVQDPRRVVRNELSQGGRLEREVMAYTASQRMEGSGPAGLEVSQASPQSPILGRDSAGIRASNWEPEPDVGRVAHGVPDRAHRLKALGNAVVPQIPELLGRAYLETLEQ